jgi:NAD-dependent dihydropyrimidine dehydrogenase PreA subunit
MAAKKLTVVISQAQGKNPVKRHLEEEIAAAMIMDPEVDVSLVPHLYDMHTDHTGLLFLRSVPGDLVVMSWIYPRAARWILSRQGVNGHEGVTLLKAEGEEDEDFEDEDADAKESQGIGVSNVPNRKIYCLDLRAYPDHQTYFDEIKRIAGEKSVQTFDLLDWIQGNPKQEQLERYLHPEKLLAANGNGDAESNESGNGKGNGHADPFAPEPTKRRWYPVIDYSRCTNCMECIDFCLFGVYGVDGQDTILVEQQDNCKKGCPACSRVCPENAIIFPGHKTPAIAGADGPVAGLKIDLSQLFGAPQKSALELAVAERDTELVADGREAVGMTVGIPKRQCGNEKPRDEMDELIDGLDGLDL